jgi:hypothetical protein
MLYALSAIDWPDYIFSIPFLIWLASLGAIGSVAFIAMNALSIQDDITFEITNMRLITIRISVGVLFAVLLSVPLVDFGFVSFCRELWKPSVFHVSDSKVITQQAALLLLPFVLGFSTSLVILIMSRMVDAIEVLFGISKEGIRGASRIDSAGLSAGRRARRSGERSESQRGAAPAPETNQLPGRAKISGQ